MKSIYLPLALAVVFTTTPAWSASTCDGWKAADGSFWKSASNETWISGTMTPAGKDSSCTPKKPRVIYYQKLVSNITSDVVTEKTPTLTKLVEKAHFDFDKAILKSEDKALLSQMIQKIGSSTIDVAVATGHTDSTGSDDYNFGLSQRRADAVKSYLTESGIDGGKIYTEAKGELSPVASNETAEGRAENRRVEVSISLSQK